VGTAFANLKQTSKIPRKEWKFQELNGILKILYQKVENKLQNTGYHHHSDKKPGISKMIFHNYLSLINQQSTHRNSESSN